MPYRQQPDRSPWTSLEQACAGDQLSDRVMRQFVLPANRFSQRHMLRFLNDSACHYVLGFHGGTFCLNRQHRRYKIAILGDGPLADGVIQKADEAI